MSVVDGAKDSSRNRLVGALSVEARELLLARAVAESLQLKTVLYAEYETPRFAYLPLTGVTSVVALTDLGATSEVGFVGCEGITGAYHLLGPVKVPNRCFVQIAGTFLRIPFSALRSAYEESAEVRRRIHQFVQIDSLSVSQMAGCNQMHSLEQRLARWLLMADDRHGSDSLPVTQEILSEMIAARRTSVTKIVGSFKAKGLVSYSRGRIKILSRRNLEEIACPCYQIARSLQSEPYV